MNRLIATRGIRSLTRCSVALAPSRGVGSATLPAVLQPPRHHPHDVSSYLGHHQPRRGLSSSDSPSHDDFSPRKKVDTSKDSESEIHELIDSHVKSNRIMLYMKGSPSQPMCGFSATVVSILKKTGADFSSVNVLDYPEVRDGVKKYSQWPTIPQLYVDGEFVGGCDIVKDMDESGELLVLLKPAGEVDGKM